MKRAYIIFLCLMSFTCGAESHWFVAAEMNRRIVPNDAAKACHIVTHQDSDGFKYWRCAENK